MFVLSVDKKNVRNELFEHLSVGCIYVVARLAQQWANEPNEPAHLKMCVSGPAFCSIATFSYCSSPCKSYVCAIATVPSYNASAQAKSWVLAFF